MHIKPNNNQLPLPSPALLCVILTYCSMVGPAPHKRCLVCSICSTAPETQTLPTLLPQTRPLVSLFLKSQDLVMWGAKWHRKCDQGWVTQWPQYTVHYTITPAVLYCMCRLQDTALAPRDWSPPPQGPDHRHLSPPSPSWDCTLSTPGPVWGLCLVSNAPLIPGPHWPQSQSSAQSVNIANKCHESKHPLMIMSSLKCGHCRERRVVCRPCPGSS